MAKLVTIYGGSGFVGRYIARRMAKAGWRVRVAVRRPNEAMFVKPYGVVGQVEPILCNIRDDASVAVAMKGADAVVNCVGTFDQFGKNNFDAVQYEGAERIALTAVKQGISKLVHISAIGADENSESVYAQTKAQGEAAILAHIPDAVILRPSVIFGHEDEFFNRFAGMSRFAPILPVVGGETKFQPVYVDDVAQVAEKAVLGSIDAGVYELGGPDVATFKSLMGDMLSVIRRRRAIIDIPFVIAKLMAFGGRAAQVLSLGVLSPPITADQVLSLKTDNIVSEGSKGFSDLGIVPKDYAAILPDYLWRFRPSGQYDAIKESARNLKV